MNRLGDFMEFKFQSEKVKFFVKTGIVVLTLLVIIGIGVKYIPKIVTVTNSANAKELPIFSVNTNEDKVSLTFDTAWGNEDIADTLAILDKYNLKATFFMTGEWVSTYPDDVKAISKAGHDLGNHSDSHKHMSQLTKEQSVEEIMKVHKKVKEITGFEMSLFRAPYGDFNNSLIDATRELDYYCIQWDVDSLDWKDYSAKSIIDNVLMNENLENGSIILMHNGAKYTNEALEAVIIGLKDKGYRIVPVSELIHKGDYYMGLDGTQYKKR